MTLDRVEALFIEVRDELARSNRTFFEFFWHGGEPLLAPRGWFSDVATLERRVFSDGQSIRHRVVTNGLLLDSPRLDELTQLGAEVVLSLEGEKAVHDAHRPRFGGGGSYDAVVRAITLLRRSEVPFDVLTVVHPGTCGDATYRHHVELGIRRMDFHLPLRNHAFSTVDYELTPQLLDDFGCWLINAFDAWRSDGANRASVRWFDSIVSQLYGGPPLLCTQAEDCGPGTLTLTSDGEFALCECFDACNGFDGTISVLGDGGVRSAGNHVSFRRVHSGGQTLPVTCRECQLVELCQGGCTAFRFVDNAYQPFSERPSVYCSAYTQFYKHAKHVLISEAVVA